MRNTNNTGSKLVTVKHKLNSNDKDGGLQHNELEKNKTKKFDIYDEAKKNFQDKYSNNINNNSNIRLMKNQTEKSEIGVYKKQLIKSTNLKPEANPITKSNNNNKLVTNFVNNNNNNISNDPIHKKYSVSESTQQLISGGTNKENPKGSLNGSMSVSVQQSIHRIVKSDLIKGK